MIACLLSVLIACGGTPGSGHSSKNSDKSLSSLVISPANPVVPMGDSERFAVTGVFSDGTRQDVTTTVTWSTTNSAIASVDKSGIAVAKHTGSAVIEAVSGSISAQVTFTVPPISLISISLTPPASSVPKGSTIQLAATGMYADGTTGDVTSSATWASSGASVASVNSSGLVTGAGPGTAMITATSGQIRGAETLTVLQPVMVSLSISSPGAAIPKGRTQQITVTGTFSDGTTQDVTGSVAWTVSPSTVAAVSPTGLVSTLEPGTATISAIAGSLNASTVITVGPAALTSLTVTPPNPSLKKGDTQQLMVTGSFTDASSQNMTGAVAWTVSSANVVTLGNGGMITALANGTAIVTATSASVSGSDTITVSGANLVSIAVSPANLSIYDGKTQQLTATGSYNDGTTQDLTGKVSWAGAVPGVVDLSSTGLLTAQGPGSATVTATSGSISGSDAITVPAINLVSIAVSPADPSVPKGETQQLIATGTYNDGSTQDLSSKVVWSGAVPGVVDLSATGLVTATSLGTATITATDGSISGMTAVTVSAAVPVSLAVSPANQSVTVGFTQQFRAVELFSDGTKRSVTTQATWTSTDPDIAAVSASGVATGADVGTASINASYRSVTGSTSLTVIPVTYVETEDSPRRGEISHTYFDQANTPGVDSALRISNSGDTAENVCAMVYVFSADQQLSECCGCRVSKNGLLTLSLTNDLASNPLTRQTLTSGTIEVDSSDLAGNPKCNPASVTPDGSLTIWATHIQAITMGTPPADGGGSQSTPAGNAPVSVQSQCQALQRLGSGQGVCTCGTGD
ncbi:MAG: Ig-like domain-containing protein [Terriglobales bacterium]